MIFPQSYERFSSAPRIYSSPENRHKHRWSKNNAGFDRYYGQIVGKCPNNITWDEAQKLLCEAIPDPPDEYNDDPYPKLLYNVRKGVIYRAVGDGRSNKYHAFPADDINSIDSDTLDILKKRANNAADMKVFKRWKKDYASRCKAL